MKRITAGVLSFLFLILAGCQRIEYRDDLPCREIADRLCDLLPVTGGYAQFGKDHLTYSFENADGYEDECLMYSVLSEDVNEIGVFLADDEEDAEELKTRCEEYLSRMREEERAFIESYAPREAAKLDASEVRVFGEYVIYTVLSPDDRDRVFDEAKKLLQE